MQTLLKKNIVQFYLQSLEDFENSSKSLLRNLSTLFFLLRRGDRFIKEFGENPFLRDFERNDGIKKLETIQQTTGKESVSQKISEILDHFYEEKSEIYEGDEEEKKASE